MIGIAAVLERCEGLARRETCMSSKPKPAPGDVFDVAKVRQFIELMNEHDLAEIDLRKGDQRIRVRRGPEMTMTAMPTMAQVAPVGGAMGRAGATEKGGGEPPADESKAQIIKSPMVGTFYASANPESPPFVKVGDRVGPETTVCIVEAMKVFNEIPAECTGRIIAVLVQSGDPVEFNQPLFRVEPS